MYMWWRSSPQRHHTTCTCGGAVVQRHHTTCTCGGAVVQSHHTTCTCGGAVVQRHHAGFLITRSLVWTNSGECFINNVTSLSPALGPFSLNNGHEGGLKQHHFILFTCTCIDMNMLTWWMRAGLECFSDWMIGCNFLCHEIYFTYTLNKNL